MNETNRKPREIEPLWNRYIHAKAAARGIPLSGNFELTPRCNFNCRMCYIHQNARAEDEWTAQEWLELGRKACDAGMVFLLLTGGEPLIRKDFREIYSGLKGLGLLISINTNASLIDRDWVEFFKKDPPCTVPPTRPIGSCAGREASIPWRKISVCCGRRGSRCASTPR